MTDPPPFAASLEVYLEAAREQLLGGDALRHFRTPVERVELVGAGRDARIRVCWRDLRHAGRPLYLRKDYFLHDEEWGSPMASPEEIAGTIFVDLLEM